MHLLVDLSGKTEPLTLGSQRAAVRAYLIGKELTAQPSEPENDFYIQEGLILGYTSNDVLEFIEVFSPSTAVVGQFSLLGQSVKSILAKLQPLGLRVEPRASCLCFDEIGMSLYAPQAVVESVSVYRKGYYDDP
jgi:hypothetical protein